MAERARYQPDDPSLFGNHGWERTPTVPKFTINISEYERLSVRNASTGYFSQKQATLTGGYTSLSAESRRYSVTDVQNMLSQVSTPSSSVMRAVFGGCGGRTPKVIEKMQQQIKAGAQLTTSIGLNENALAQYNSATAPDDVRAMILGIDINFEYRNLNSGVDEAFVRGDMVYLRIPADVPSERIPEKEQPLLDDVSTYSKLIRMGDSKWEVRYYDEEHVVATNDVLNASAEVVEPEPDALPPLDTEIDSQGRRWMKVC
jgi:hypothetical protein